MEVRETRANAATIAFGIPGIVQRYSINSGVRTQPPGQRLLNLSQRLPTSPICTGLLATATILLGVAHVTAEQFGTTIYEHPHLWHTLRKTICCQSQPTL